jgi:hypothetical protein
MKLNRTGLLQRAIMVKSTISQKKILQMVGLLLSSQDINTRYIGV